MTILNFKAKIEAALRIGKWSPTDTELREISRKIRSHGQKLTSDELERIVSSVVGPFLHSTMEGVDNSDLKTILVMATKIED